MARQDLVICGFEHGLLAAGGMIPAELDNVNAQCKLSTAWKRSGTYSLWHDYETAAANTQGDLPFTGRISTTKKHRRVKFSFRIEDPGGTGFSDPLWLFQWGTGLVGLRILRQVSPAGYFIYPAVGAQDFGGNNYNLGVAPQEHITEFYWFDDATNPGVKVYVDGILRITVDDPLFNVGSTETFLHFGQTIGKGIIERYRPYFDDLWAMCGDAESDTIPDPLPKIIAALPNLDGDLEEWTGSPDATNHYTNVDDAASASKDDTSYNESGVVLDVEPRELYNFQSCADIGLAPSDLIVAVQTSCIARVTAGTNGTPYIVVKTGGGTYNLNVSPSSSYADGAYTRFDLVQPNGNPWTQADLDAFQAGMGRAKVMTSDPRNVRLTSAMLMVGYQPAVRRPIRVI